MRKRDELADPNSCLNKARDDEWLFVLLGRDRAAVYAVEAWVDARIRLHMNRPIDQKIKDARKWVATVEAELEIAAKRETESRP